MWFDGVGRSGTAASIMPEWRSAGKLLFESSRISLILPRINAS
jgi:hypothetical protein